MNFLKSLLAWFLRIILLLCIIAICGYKILTSSKWTEKFAGQIINRQVTNASLKDLKIKKIILTPNDYIWEKVSFHVTTQGQDFFVNVDRAQIHNLTSEKWDVFITDLHLTNTNISLSNANLYGKFQWKGPLTFKGLVYAKVLNDNYKGIVAGPLAFKGTAKSISKFNAHLTSTQGDIASSLIRYLMGDVNNNLSFLPFENQLNKKKFIRLENLNLTIHNRTQDKFEIQMSLNSNELNLKLNPTLTINLR
ncbi:MAG: hypothetical protein HQL26_05370 [Candidatus Omnitrophica bacterium]|nr:hypothetical protein [Candidatus Omnitrophota bacterium]